MESDKHVLDIPAISYADVERQQRERAVQRDNPGGAAPGTTTPSTTKERKRMPREAVIGPQIVAAVDAKLAEGGLNRSQAFAAVGAERGMRPGTVAANYYRVVRKQNPGALKPTRRRGGRRTAAARPAASATRARRGGRTATVAAAPAPAGDVQAIAAQLVANVEALARAVTAQAQEVKDLRARLDGVRSLLG